jgi:hypothetical protein
MIRPKQVLKIDMDDNYGTTDTGLGHVAHLPLPEYY